ncbi:MAG TPA: pyruvate, phosphate dikinase [Candidatus Xenobia bacterium]
MPTTTATKPIYLFEEGNASMRDLLGGKGAGLAEMTGMGLPVPPGFTITTQQCLEYYKQGKKMPAGLSELILENVKTIEKKMGKGFGDPKNPLLVSVRSGARESMPGMMDTVLNLGLNDQTVEGLAKLTGDARFAYDAFRRFIQMFSDVVLNLKKRSFEEILSKKKKAQGVKEDSDLTADSLKALVSEYREHVKKSAGREFPMDVKEQLLMAVQAVFASWNNERAIVYREKENIPHDLGTAVNVQSMVFGNMGSDCGTGVSFTRNYNTGAKEVTGDFLFNAQGEDVVAGIRTPLQLSALKDKSPEIHQQLVDISANLEKHYRDMQDMEFTVERGKIFMLQTRRAKRTAQAAVKIAVDMEKEGLITQSEAIQRVSADQIDQLLHPYFPVDKKKAALEAGRLVAKGIPASPGAACGEVVFEAVDALKLKAAGKPVILVRPETTPDDAQGMLASVGILTSTGGPTSHAALVARGWGIPCVVGCEALSIDLEKKTVTAGNKVWKEGQAISIDGSTGEVMEGTIDRVSPSELTGDAKLILDWADKVRKLGVYANADNPKDAARARAFGAEGIGLCRTEHMFMETDRLPIVQRMIMAAPEAERLKRGVHRLELDVVEAAGHKKEELQHRLDELKKELAGPWKIYQETLTQLLPVQREDFRGILKAMEGCWVIIRLLDPPLHEFLPNYEELLVEVAEQRMLQKFADQKVDVSKVGKLHSQAEQKEREALLGKVRSLKEFNPMLGLRVCRLGIVYPEIYRMQVRALFEAACELKSKGVDVKPEVMIPGVGHVNEMKFTRDMVQEVAQTVLREKGVTLTYKVGTMVELPRATVVAGSLAQHAEFFSFGTNDLTQTTFGYSRDDAAGTFIPVYIEKKILERDPFQVLDSEGVGQLMRMAVEAGRHANAKLEVGICGEHGGEPHSIAFCHSLGLNYVSCSPYRVPIARLAAAQAALASQPKSGKSQD